jgi:AraC family transcriptional regulator of arabinose operon
MQLPALEIIDPALLPRPDYDAAYERGLVSDHYEVRRGYHVMRREGTLTSYLMYSVSGQGFVRDRENRAIRLGPGDVALIEAQTYQEYGIWPRAHHWHCHWVHFDAQPHWAHWLPLSQAVGLEGVSYAHIPSLALQRQVGDLFFELQWQRLRPEVWRHALALNLLERILILIQSGGQGRPALDARVSRVLDAIEASAHAPLSSSELAAIAGLSPSRLAFLFRKQTGLSILGAIHRARLQLAQHALEEPFASLKDAAERSGFQSPYSFSNWFLKQTGLRPSEYRSQALERRPALRPMKKSWLEPQSAPQRVAPYASGAEQMLSKAAAPCSGLPVASPRAACPRRVQKMASAM